MKMIVADDSAILREGLVGLIERRGHEVVEAVGDAPSLIRAVDDHPDVDMIVTDVRMPPGMSTDGLDAATTLAERHPTIPIMILSQYVAPAYASRLITHPSGFGYLLKDRVARVADFMTSLEVVAGGGVVIDPDVARQLSSGRTGPLDTLTERERDVLALMAEGRSNAQIAEELFLSGGAVSKYVASIFLKLGMSVGEENRRVRAVLAYLTVHNDGMINSMGGF